MKRTLIRVALLACLVSGYAFADVFHPEDPNIRGHLGKFLDDVCFNNDGITNSDNCPNPASPNEGYVFVIGSSWQGSLPGVFWCGASAVQPVSGASCFFASFGTLALCTPDNYVLVKTLLSGHYFALRAGSSCGIFDRPEAEVIFPCLSTDAFDPAVGCAPTKPTAISVEDSYIKLDTIDAPPTPNIDCNDVSHEGRMVVDSTNSKLYICTQSGWESFSADPP